MTCACRYGYEDCDEPSTLWREGRVTRTRRVHSCEECGDEIPAGSRACFAASLYDGQWTTMYRCVTCATLAELVAETLQACPGWGVLRDECDSAEIDWWEWHDRAKTMEVST